MAQHIVSAINTSYYFNSFPVGLYLGQREDPNKDNKNMFKLKNNLCPKLSL